MILRSKFLYIKFSKARTHRSKPRPIDDRLHQDAKFREIRKEKLRQKLKLKEAQSDKEAAKIGKVRNEKETSKIDRVSIDFPLERLLKPKNTDILNLDNLIKEDFKPRISKKSNILAKQQRSKSLAKSKIDMKSMNGEYKNDIYNRQIREKQLVEQLLKKEKSKKDKDELKS
jgi:hypothetical protein